MQKDYAITDISPKSINAFLVKQQLTSSDHSQTVQYLQESDKPSVHPLPVEKKTIFTETKHYMDWKRLEEFKLSMDSTESVAMLNSFHATSLQPNPGGRGTSRNQIQQQCIWNIGLNLGQTIKE